MRRALPLLALASLALPAHSAASPGVRFGVADEVWLRDGPGTLAERLDTLERLGAEIGRVTVRWEEPAWRRSDAVLVGLRARGIEPVVTLTGPSRWIRARPARAPTFGAFAGAAARRWPWVRRWIVWERPSRAMNAVLYARRALGPAYASIKRATPRARVAAGDGSRAWLSALARTGARLDAYAFRSTRVARPLLGAPVWLTVAGAESGRRGVSEAAQATELSKAAFRAYRLPGVELSLHARVRDGARRNGLFERTGEAKLAANAFSFPLVQSGRRGESAIVWGQVRPRRGPQRFRLQLLQGGETSWLGGVRTTTSRGYFTAVLEAPSGALLRIWSLGDRLFGAPLLLR
jgi:hypothetical protein